MKLRYIGKEYSGGPVKGNVYDVIISTAKRGGYYVKQIDTNDKYMYSSLEAIFDSWVSDIAYKKICISISNNKFGAKFIANQLQKDGYVDTDSVVALENKEDKSFKVFTNCITLVDTDSVEIANKIIDENLEEFHSMYTGRDPRETSFGWIDIEDVKEIHRSIVTKFGASDGIHNPVDLDYAIKQPLTNLVGVPKRSIFERICACSYLLGRCFVDCGAQVAATVFILLCRKNKIGVLFKLGDIYDIFTHTIGPDINPSDFEKLLYPHIVKNDRTTGESELSTLDDIGTDESLKCTVKLEDDGIPIGAFKNKTNAINFQNKLKDQGISTSIKTDSVSSKSCNM